MKKFILTTLILFCAIPCLAQEISAENNLQQDFIPQQQIKDILKYDKYFKVNSLVTKTNKTLSSDFAVAHERFLQSNINASYNEYEKLTHNANNDFIRIMLIYELSEKGFFSLVQENFNNIENTYTFNDTIKFIKKMYFPQKTLTKDEELKLATYYTDVYYNNLHFETAKTLSKDSNILKKSDYAYFILSKAYLEAQEPFKALNTINKAITLNKDNLNYKKYKAQILTEEKKYNEALKIINELIVQSSSSVIINEQMITLKNYILAQSKKDKAQSKYYLAKYLYQTGDIQRAIKELNTSISAQKKNIDAYNLLGEIYLSENNLFKASESYKKAQNINKNNSQTLVGLGNIEFYWDDYDKAIEFYSLALKKQKNNEEAILNLAICYAMKNDMTNSQNKIQKLLFINPNAYKGYYLMSFLDKHNTDLNLKKVISLNPIFLNAWGDLACIAFKNNNYNQGNKYLFPLEYLSYKNFMYYYCIGLIHKKNGNFIEAKKDFEKVLNKYPKYEPAQIEYNELDKIKNLEMTEAQQDL